MFDMESFINVKNILYFMGQLSGEKTLKLLNKYKIPVVNTSILTSKEKVLKAATAIGYPVVLKLDSPEIVHKSDAGAVITNIANRNELENAYDKLKSIDVKLNGYIISKQVTGTEVIVGGKKDEHFGAVVMFGVGGVFVEILKDVSLRIAPVMKKDAYEMLDEIQARGILDGERGYPKANRVKLAELIVNVSKLIYKEDIEELDLNPCFVDENSVGVADFRMLVRDKSGKP